MGRETVQGAAKVRVTSNALMDRYRLHDDWDGNVTIIVIPEVIPVIPRQENGRILPAAAAADLLDEDDPRARHGGTSVLHDCRVAVAERGWLPGGIS